MNIFSIKLLMFFFGEVHVKVIFFTNDYEVCRWIVNISISYLGTKTEHTIYYKNIISKNIEAERLKEYSHTILEIHIL